MQCVILAGGLGTRMWPHTQTVPKTLLPVAGRPFADWQLEWLAASGVTSVVYCIGHLGDQVRAFVGNGARWGMRVAYADEGDRPRGTAGALRLADALGLLDEHFLVLYGDSWLQVDPSAVGHAHRESGRSALMTVLDNHDEWDPSNAVVGEGLVTRYEKSADPKPPEMHWIDYGLCCLTRQVVSDIEGADPVDLAPVLGDLARRRELAAYETPERFYEIGSADGLAALQDRLARLNELR
jgi:NDP-sugar pyrophosphorylase family protein